MEILGDFWRKVLAFSQGEGFWGIDKGLKAGIIVDRKRALPVDGCPSAG